MEMEGYWKLKEEKLNRTLWRIRIGRGYGSVVKQTAEWMNFNQISCLFKLILKLQFFVCHTDSQISQTKFIKCVVRGL